MKMISWKKTVYTNAYLKLPTLAGLESPTSIAPLPGPIKTRSGVRLKCARNPPAGTPPPGV